MSTDRRPIILVALAVFLSRVALLLLTRSYRHPHLWEFETIADNILAGRGFAYPFLGTVYHSYNPPLYDWICAGVYWLTHHSHVAILLVQAASTSALCITLWAIGCRIATPTVGLLGALLAGGHPGLVYYDVCQVVPLSFDAWLFALTLWGFLRCWERPTRRRLLGTGVIMGFSALSRGSAMLFLVPGLVWLGRVRRSRWRDIAASGVTLFMGMLLVVGPWIARNCWVHRRWIPWINTTTGELFWLGNNAHATGGAYASAGQTVLELAPPAFRRELEHLDELGQKAAFEREARRFIRAHPRAFVRLTFAKFLQFWGSAPQRGLLYPPLYLKVYTWYYIVLMLGGILGFVHLLRAPPTPWTRGGLVAMGLLMLTLSITHSFFYVEGRHRWGIEPLLLLLTAQGVVLMASRRPEPSQAARHVPAD